MSMKKFSKKVIKLIKLIQGHSKSKFQKTGQKMKKK